MAVTINTGESRTYDGVTYTATQDAVLNLDDAGKVSGIASGSVVAKLTDSDSSPEITFDGSTAFDFSCSSWESAFGTKAIQTKFHGATVNYSSGQVTYKADGVSSAGEVSVAGAIANILPFNVAINIPDAGMKISYDENNISTFSASEKVNATLTFPEELTILLENIKGLLGPILKVDEDTVNKIYDLALKLVTSPTIAQLEGSISWNKDEKKLGITKDSNLALNILDYNLSLAAENGNVDGLGFFLKLTGEDVALGAKFTPSADQNASLHLKAAENNSQIYDGLINVTSGAIDLDIINAKISTEKDTAFTISQGDYLSKFALNNAASLTFSADSQGILYFKTEEDSGSLNFTLYNGDNECFSGNVETNGSFTLDTENKIIGVTKDTTSTISIGDYVLTVTATENTSTNIAFKNDEISFTPQDTSGAFNLLFKQGDITFFDGALKIIGGTASFNPTTQKFSFTEGSEVSITLSQTQYDFKVVGGDASFKVEAQGSGKFIITPDNGDGSLDILVRQTNGNSSATIAEEYYTTLNTTDDDANAFYSNISISNGSIVLDEMGKKIGLTAGTTANVTLGKYVIAITTNKDVNFGLSVQSDGSTAITPQENDNAFDISVSRDGTTIFTNTLNISGSFTLGQNGTLTVAKDTELQIDFGDGYIVNFKATDKAGGAITLDAEGITFAPNSDGGSLQLSITRDGQTRSASLDVTGSITYKLDGAISLAQGTVLKSVFDSGNILTITANANASGSIVFNPQTGLDITPTTPDAFSLLLSTESEDIIKIASVTGSINYTNRTFTASDGTAIRFVDPAGYYNDNVLRTAGGTTSLHFGDDGIVYTANEGATFTMDYLQGTTWELQQGTITDNFSGPNQGKIILSEGAIFHTNDYEFPFTLGTVGNYSINGMNITTTAENAEVTLTNYDTITLDGVSYTALDDDVQLTFDANGKVAGLTSGKVQATIAGAENSPVVTFDATNEAIDFAATSNGEVLWVTTRYTMELIEGDFTFKDSTITASAGSRLAAVNQVGDYSLRNEDFYEYGATYSFNNTSVIINSQHTISQFSLTNSTDTRTINLEAFGTVINKFAERGFTLVAGTKEVMHIGDYTLTATAIETAGLNISLGADGVTLVPNSNDGTLNITLSRGDLEIISGELECTSGSITLGFDKAVTLAENTSFNFTWNDYVTSVTTTAEATTDIALTDTGLSFTPHDGDGALNILITKEGTPIFGGALNVTGGTISFDVTTQKFSFTEGTKIALGIGDGSQEMDIEIVGGNASFKVEADTSGNFTVTPDTGDGSIDITFKQGGETVFKNNVSVNGSIIINPVTNLLTLVDGTTVNIAFDNYTLTATADGDASSEISLTASGISITPQTGDGKLNLTLTGTSSGSLSASIEVLSGGFVFGTTGALTVTEGTELQIDFGDGYIVNFKATDDAGGAISLGADGITFAPNSDDGSLELSITRDGQTRSASLDVTGGSVTYKLDGSISLTKGTVVRNVFEDGNILTITANTDASGSITFNPQTGLTIAPASADALNVVLTKGNLDTVISSINGIINYRGGIVTASDGTTANMRVHDTWEIKFSTEGGTASIQFTDDRTIYTANEGATFAVDYLNGTTLEIENGTYSDIYATETSGEIELISEGSTFRSNDDEEAAFTLEKAGNYTLNGMSVTTTEDNVEVQLTNYDTITFGQGLEVNIATTLSGSPLDVTAKATQGQGSVTVSDDGKITYDATSGTLQITTGLEEIFGESILSDTFDISGGTISFDTTNNKITCAAGSTLSFTQSGQIITLTTSKDISATYKVEDEIYYLKLDDSAKANVTITRDGEKIVGGEMEMGGVYSYRPETGTFGLTGANSSHGDGTNTFFQFAIDGQASTSRLETNDTTIVFIPTLTEDKYEINFPNERKHAMKLTITRDGQTIFENKIAIDGVVGLGTSTQELSLNKGTVLTLTQGENAMEITALEDAGGQISFIEGGIRFAPNSGDGALELNFVTTERKANLNITGAIILGEDGKISLENGTQINLDWEDGTNLKMTSHGSNGSIGLSEKGIQITSEDEKLDIDLTLPTGVQTHLSGIKGTIYYNAGKVSFEENSKITATTTLGGQPVLMTLETIGGTGHISFADNGVIYSADTGAMRITWSRDGLESTFTVNSGTIQIGHGLFKLAEGTDLATDLKNFVPALYFTTSDAGTYIINGQTITTSAENIPMTATDDYMTFTTSDNVVTYDGMTFAGAGKVSLTPNSVVLGAGVEAEGFGKDKSFVLAEAGNVTADARIFELAEEVPTGLTVTGAQDGFIFSRTTTEESESRFSNPNPDNVGKIFTEKFIASGDSSYRIQTDLLGLQQIIGISGDTTILGSASFDGEPEETVFDIVTNSEGVFTVGEKKYIISGDSSVAIMADFEPDKSYVRGFKDLSGIASGDFNDHAVTVNGGIPIVVKGGKIVDIVADENGQEVFGIRDGESLVASLAGSYTVDIRAIELIEDVPKGITIEGTAGGDFKIGSTSDSGEVLVENFSATGGDYAYSLQISTLGLEKVLGVSDGTTITGGADIDGEISDQDFDIITKTEGAFTFGKRTYSISGDSSVSIKAAFKLDEGYAYSFDGLSGTVSGNFNDGDFSVNGGESILISGDSSIDLVAGAKGIELFNVSGGVSLIEMGGVSKVHTDTEGTFTFGNGGGDGDTVAITIQGDDNVTFELNDAQYVKSITNIEGDIFFSETNSSLSINGISGTFSGEFSSIGAYSSALYIHDAQDGSGFATSDEDKVWLQLRGGSFALNDNSLTLTNDADGIWLREKEIVGLDEGASLQVGEAGNYIANEISLSAKADDIIVGLKDSAYIYDPNNPLMTKNTPTAEIIQQITGGDSSINTVVASGRENLSLKGGDLVIVENTPAQVSITASKGNDTIASKGGNVHIKLNGTGKTDLFALDGKMTLEGYDAATGTGFGTNYSDILTAINNDAIDFDKGKLTIDSAVVTFDKDSELINFYDAAGELQKIGYAASDELLNASKQKADLILFAKKYSSITGGAGSDSIFADAGSYVDAGAGKNYIELEKERDTQDGAIINIINGNNTIANFNVGFDDSSDVIENSSKYWDNKFDGTDIIIKTDGGKTVINNVSSGEEFIKFKENANGYEYKVALAQENSVIVASNDSTNVYRGEKSGVDFTDFEESLLVNLNEGAEGKAVGESIYFYGINRVTVGGGLNTLISSSANETLTGSDGTTEYIFDKDSGRDVIQNLNFDEDKINVGTNAVTDVRINNAGGVRMEIGGSAVLTLADAQGKNFKINNLVALVDKNLTYNDEANYFVATAQNATLSVGADISDAKIWLDGSQGKTFVGDIRTIDASNSTVKAELAGNDLDNRIFAGQGDASLWGGNGGNDLLVGGAGKNTFYYTTGNGSDTISGANAGDVVYLTQVSLDQISGTNVTNNIATINFVDGGQLTINDAANCNFVLAQGEEIRNYGVSGNSFVAK